MPVPTPERAFKVAGARPRRSGNVDDVTGRARSGVGLALPGMRVRRILHSPHARAGAHLRAERSP